MATESDIDVMVSNFTFRFPPKTGFSYHVPTFGMFSEDNKAQWTTNFKNGNIRRFIMHILQNHLCPNLINLRFDKIIISKGKKSFFGHKNPGRGQKVPQKFYSFSKFLSPQLTPPKNI